MLEDVSLGTSNITAWNEADELLGGRQKVLEGAAVEV